MQNFLVLKWYEKSVFSSVTAVQHKTFYLLPKNCRELLCILLDIARRRLARCGGERLTKSKNGYIMRKQGSDRTRDRARDRVREHRRAFSQTDEVPEIFEKSERSLLLCVLMN